MVASLGWIIGGIAGVLIGILLGDPFRNSQGQFTSRQNGFVSWVIQLFITGGIGALAGDVLLPIILDNQLTGIVVVVLVGYIVYRFGVDPR